MRIIFVILICASHLAAGQSVAELKQLLSADDDSTRVAALGRLAMQYGRSDPDSAFYFGRLSLNEALKINLRPGEASAYNALGTLHFFQSNYDSTMLYFNKCLTIARELNDSIRMGAMYNNIGMVLTYQTKYDSSLQLLYKAREIRENIEPEKLTSTLNNIGIAYQRMEDFEKAYEFLVQAAELKEKYGQELSLSNTLNNIGIVLKKLGRDEEAVPFYERSLKIAEDYNDKTKQANAHNNLAAIYHMSPDLYSRAEFHYRKSISLKEDMGDQTGLFNSYTQLADLLSSLDKNREAGEYLQKAERAGEEIGQNLFTSTFLETKSRILSRQGKTKEAYEVLKQAYNLKTEEMTLDRNDKIAELEARFESAKKEAEIQRLGLANELKDANLSRSRNAQLAMGIGGGMTIILLVVFFTLRNKKLRAEREAQELQVDALKKRFMELHSSPAELAVALEFNDLNEKLNTPLTEREFDALKLSIEGKSNTEIAEALFISVSTVKFHLRNTYSKMGVGNRKEAFQYMLKTS